MDYYQGTNYTDELFLEKQQIIKELLSDLQPKTILDLGANTGIFSRQGKDIQNCYIISSDIDSGAVEINYQEVKKNKEKNILPLIIDLTNPSPSIGWNNKERVSFLHRAKADVVMALALIHHLAISNNVPLQEISKTLAGMGEYLIIEFVPKEEFPSAKFVSNQG